MAERRNSWPWELYDERTPRRYWRQCLEILDSARDEVKRLKPNATG